MKKRMSAMLLCMAMVLSLLPMAALAAEDDVLYVGGTNVISGGYWKGDGSGGLTAGSEDDYTVWYNPSTSTLTLKDASITKAYTKHTIAETTHDVYSEIGIAQKLTGYSEEIEVCGIYSSLSLNICLVGTNTIALERIDSSVSNAPTDRDFVDIRLFSYGIYACEETYTELGDGSGGYTSTELLPITISGSGSCSVSASEVNAKDMAQVQTFGLCAKSLVINNSELTVSGGSAVGAEEDLTLVKGSGNVYTTGIWARTVTINNGSVVAFGGTAQGGSETISQGITGPFWQAAVTLNGGSLESRGGSIPGTAGSSMGIGGYVTLNGGVVKAFGGTVTAGTTVGIMTGGSSLGGSVDMKINAGTLIAASGKNEDANGEQYAVQYWSTTITPPTEYWWRTAETDAYTNGAETTFTLAKGQTYIDITTTAPSDSSTSPLYVGGTDVSGGGYWTGDGSGGLTGGTASNYTVRYEPGTSTLTLRNAKISQVYTMETGELDEAGDDFLVQLNNYGIYSTQDLNLRLEGNSTFTMPSMSLSDFGKMIPGSCLRYLSSTGIHVQYEDDLYNAAEDDPTYAVLTVSGSGSCTITGGTLNCDNIDRAFSYAVSAGRLVMESGSLTGTGSKIAGALRTEMQGSGSVLGIGIRTVVDLTVNGGQMTGFGSEISLEKHPDSVECGNAGESYGIYTYGNLTLNQGTIKGVSGTVNADSGDSGGLQIDSTLDSFMGSVSLPSTYWWRTGESAAFTASADGICTTQVSTLFGPVTRFIDASYLEITTTEPIPDDPSTGDEDDVVPPTTYTITVPNTANGSVTVSPKSAAQGDTVTITATPDTGYQLNKLTVTDKSGSSIKLADKGNGIYTFTMPDSEAFVAASFTELELPALVLPFTDVTASDWYYDAVAYVYDNGLMTGTSATTFSPKATTTRGMIVTILHRLEGCPAADASGFADVKSGAWYQEAVDWAAANGIVNGTSDTTFAPTSPITREQMAAILYRYAAYKGYDVSQLADLNRFSDSSTVSVYAADALAWANAAGLITGVTDTSLSPQGSAVRAQVATILMRFCENIAQ